MLKSLLVSLAVTCVSAEWIINPMELYQAGIVKGMFLSLKNNIVKAPRDPVVFAMCKSPSTPNFQLDTSNTNSNPDPVVKGSKVALNLAGSWSQAYTIQNVHLDVTWNNTPLYKEDHKTPQSVSGPYTYSLNWEVPSYAPSGHYHVTMTWIDGSGATQSCITADFDL